MVLLYRLVISNCVFEYFGPGPVCIKVDKILKTHCSINRFTSAVLKNRFAYF